MMSGKDRESDARIHRDHRGTQQTVMEDGRGEALSPEHLLPGHEGELVHVPSAESWLAFPPSVFLALLGKGQC